MELGEEAPIQFFTTFISFFQYLQCLHQGFVENTFSCDALSLAPATFMSPYLRSAEHPVLLRGVTSQVAVEMVRSKPLRPMNLLAITQALSESMSFGQDN